MVENWDQYKDLEYYPDRVCGCSCMGKIKVQAYHKYWGIPTYLPYHSVRVTGAPSKKPSARKKLSEGMKGDKNPAKRPDVRKKLSIAQTGKTRTKESIDKQKKTQKSNVKWHAAMKTRKPPRLGTETSKEGLANIRSGAKKRKKPTKEIKEAIQRGMLAHFSIPENRMKRAKQLSERMEKGFPFKMGRVDLPRLGVNIFHRSSYELSALLLLDSFEEVCNIAAEGVHLFYFDPASEKNRVYTPDFLITLDSGQKILIEVKPECFMEHPTNKAKFEAASNWALSRNISFCVWTEEILYNDSSTTTMSLQAIVEATVANSIIPWGMELKV